MVHCIPDFKTKKDLLKFFKEGGKIKVFNPSGIFPLKPNSWGVIEAPSDYHRFYVSVDWDGDYIVTNIRVK